MGPITSIFPVARVVPCAGRKFKVAEFRLRDLVRLQGYLDEMAPDPFVAACEAGKGLSEPEQMALFADAYDLAEAGPMVYGDDRAKAYFSTPEGASLFLLVALDRENDISPAEAATLFLRSTSIEYGHIWRIAHGVTSLEVLSHILLPPAHPGGQRGDGPTWGEMVHEVMEYRPNFSFDDILNMTITQWLSVRNGGKPPSYDRAIMPGEDLEAIVKEQQRKMGIIDQGGGSVPAVPKPLNRNDDPHGPIP